MVPVEVPLTDTVLVKTSLKVENKLQVGSEVEVKGVFVVLVMLMVRLIKRRCLSCEHSYIFYYSERI